DAPPPTAVAVTNGGVVPPKSLVGPENVNRTWLKLGTLPTFVPSPFFRRNVTVTGPPAAPVAVRISPWRPASGADFRGITCAPGIVLSNSVTCVSVWQRRQYASGCGPATCPAPGARPFSGVSPGLMSSWQPVHVSAEGFFR